MHVYNSDCEAAMRMTHVLPKDLLKKAFLFGYPQRGLKQFIVLLTLQVMNWVTSTMNDPRLHDNGHTTYLGLYQTSPQTLSTELQFT